MSAFAEATHVQANLPETLKRGLVRDRVRRANLVVQMLNEVKSKAPNHAVTVSLQESGRFLKAEFKERHGWAHDYAQPNDEIRRGRLKLTRGNGFSCTTNIDILGGRDMRSRRTGSRDPLWLPLRWCEHDGAVWVEIVYHRQTRRADPRGRSRRAMGDKLAGVSEALHEMKVPHKICGDDNGRAEWADDLPWLRDIQRGPDHALVSKDIEVFGVHTLHRPGLTDHEILVFDYAVPKKVKR